MHDKKLFTQPDGCHLGECPLCFLPMPLDPQKTTFKACCSKIICEGCVYAHIKSNGGERCPFCRELTANKEECIKRIMKRIKANDPAACQYVKNDTAGLVTERHVNCHARETVGGLVDGVLIRGSCHCHQGNIV